jgi:hypothetical protein
MVDVTMSMDEYLSLLGGLTQDSKPLMPENPLPGTKKRKQSTAYQRKYKSNFKKVAPKFKLKNGKWKKNGFKSAVKLAHKMSRK